MTKVAIMQMVENAIVLDREIAEKEEELKALKESLIQEAAKAKERTETDGGGWSVVFEGSAGNIARVTQPGPKLKSSIDGEKVPGAKVLTLVGKLKDELFTPRLTYVPVENFRARTEELFAPGLAARIIQGCESKSAAAVAFETKDGN